MAITSDTAVNAKPVLRGAVDRSTAVMGKPIYPWLIPVIQACLSALRDAARSAERADGSAGAVEAGGAARVQPRPMPVGNARKYLKTVDRLERLEADEERLLIRRYQSGDKAARDRIVQANLWIVPVIVRRLERDPVKAEDLIGEGNLALFHALDRFDLSHPVRFSTYAKWAVFHAVALAATARSNLIRIPRKGARNDAANPQPQPQSQPAAPRGLPDTAPKRNGLPSRRMDAQPRERITTVAIEDVEDQIDSGVDYELAQDAVQPEAIVSVQQLLNAMQARLTELPTRDRFVLEARFGLNNRPQRTLHQIGAELQLSAEGVRKVQLAALSRLRALLLGD